MKRLVFGVTMWVVFGISAGGGEFEGYSKREFGAPTELRAFDNAEFDDLTKFGRENANVEYGKFGFNGNGGLRIRPLANGRTHRFQQRVALAKGKRYIFSADVHTHGKASAQIAVDTFWKDSRKYASGYGAWGASSKPLADGWKTFWVTFVAKEGSDKIDYHFIAHCPGKNTYTEDDWIDIDNISLREDVPVWYFCNTWPVHNKIYCEEGRIRCHSWFFGDFLEKDGKDVYELKLLRGDGASAAASPLARCVLAPDETGVMTAAFGKLDYRGPATLTATIYDTIHRQELGTKTLEIEICPAPDRSKHLFVQENGVVLRNGEPFMPFGFYTDLADPKKYDAAKLEAELKKLHEAGFNAMIDYQSYSLRTGPRCETYYRLCEKYGIGVLTDAFGHGSATTNAIDKSRALAAYLEKFPSLIGFYTMDEGAESVVPGLAATRRMLNEVCPGRMVNICNIMRAAPYLPAADIQGGDAYPIRLGGGGMMDTHNRVTRMQECGPAAIWWAPQCYNWVNQNQEARTNAVLYRKLGREPTENELLAVALLNAADGVTAFFFYSLFDLYRGPIPEWVDRRWTAMCNIAKVFKDLEPFILSGEKIIDVPHKDAKDPVRVAALSDGKGRWRVIVVGLGKNHDTTFTLPASYGQLRGMCGNAVFANGIYTYKAEEYVCDLLR